MKTLILFFLVCFAAKAQVTTSGKGKISVEIEQLRNNKGKVGVSLHNNATAFPGDASKSFRNAFASIKDGEAIVVFDQLPEGTYAVAVFHDENDNKQLDTGIFGIPKEGYGTSKDAKGILGPPKFTDASFRLGTENLNLKVKMNY